MMKLCYKLTHILVSFCCLILIEETRFQKLAPLLSSDKCLTAVELGPLDGANLCYWTRGLLCFFNQNLVVEDVKICTCSTWYCSLKHYWIEKFKMTDTCFNFQPVVLELLSSERSTEHLLSRFQEFTAYEDVLYYVWKLLPTVVLNKQQPSEIFIKNFLSLMDKIPIPKETIRNKGSWELLLCGREGMCESCPKNSSLTLPYGWAFQLVY
jgi:hypothetical protein